MPVILLTAWRSTVCLVGMLWLAGPSLFAQGSCWSLQRCILFARQHNLSISQGILNERAARLQWEQSRLSLLPDLSVNTSYGRNYGRSVDPTSNAFVNTTYDFTGLSGSSGVLLFGWFRKHREIEKNNQLYQASEAAREQLEADISLQVVTGYLRILLAGEQVKICIDQLQLSGRQVMQTEALLRGGRSNGLDLAQVKTQLASDSLAYFRSCLDRQQAIIDMKALLNLDFRDSFQAVSMDTTALEGRLLAGLPEDIYQVAMAQSGRIRSAELKIRSAALQVQLARSNALPQLNLSASSGSNYSATYNEWLPDGSIRRMSFGKQLRNNLSQSIYLGLNIPVFSGLSARYVIKQAKLDQQQSAWQRDDAAIALKKDIYKACNELQAADRNLRVSESLDATAFTGFDFAQKRYEKGLIAAMELLQAQNALFRAEIAVSTARYEFLFKCLVIDYYLGRGYFK